MTNKEIIHIKCPTCNKTVEWNERSPYRPFCSKRCQLIDLGTWANEENRIPSDNPDQDSEIDYDGVDLSLDKDHK